LWLRGKSLQQVGNQREAMNALAELVRDFPDSLKRREAKLLWAQGAMQRGKPRRFPNL
jgi:hypothetical protein